MIICICNRLNDEEIELVIEMHPNVDVYELHDVMDCNSGCGHCIPMINELITNRRDKKE
jgi:bacterioferritin-associated ferredoxin